MKEKPRFYKYKTLKNFEFLLDMILKERLYAASYHELNDPMEGVIKVDETVPKDREAEWEDIIQNLGITCFTKDSENTLMWSHYADGGKGCVVEFELLDEQEYHKVSYLKKPILKNKDINFLKALEVLKYKDKPWKYEAEYRCILVKEKFLPVNIKSITFGTRSDTETVDMLMHILSLCKPNLKVQRKSGTSVFKGGESFSSGTITRVVKTTNLDECLDCASSKMTVRDFVGIHRNWKDY
jgi:hypothetical protein